MMRERTRKSLPAAMAAAQSCVQDCDGSLKGAKRANNSVQACRAAATHSSEVTDPPVAPCCDKTAVEVGWTDTEAMGTDSAMATA
jgi:hypothetical protein